MGKKQLLKENESLKLQLENSKKSKRELDNKVVFSQNERVIWDSHFGYDIGYFLGDGWAYNTYLIDIRTGRIVEECSLSKSEVHKYTDELIDKLTAKYGYEKRFSDTF